jgi:hypothetical protein
VEVSLITYKIKNEFGISYEYEILLLVEFTTQKLQGGAPFIIAYDVNQYFGWDKISYQRACNMLRRLHQWGFLHRKKEDKQNRRGPRMYLYTLTESGQKKCNYLHSQGFYVKADPDGKQTQSSNF